MGRPLVRQGRRLPYPWGMAWRLRPAHPLQGVFRPDDHGERVHPRNPVPRRGNHPVRPWVRDVRLRPLAPRPQPRVPFPRICCSPLQSNVHLPRFLPANIPERHAALAGSARFRMPVHDIPVRARAGTEAGGVVDSVRHRPLGVPEYAGGRNLALALRARLPCVRGRKGACRHGNAKSRNRPGRDLSRASRRPHGRQRRAMRGQLASVRCSDPQRPGRRQLRQGYARPVSHGAGSGG